MSRTRESYEARISQDLAWLEANAPDSPERRRIAAVLRASTDLKYGPPPQFPCEDKGVRVTDTPYDWIEK